MAQAKQDASLSEIHKAVLQGHIDGMQGKPLATNLNPQPTAAQQEMLAKLEEAFKMIQGFEPGFNPGKRQVVTDGFRYVTSAGDVTVAGTGRIEFKTVNFSASSEGVQGVGEIAGHVSKRATQLAKAPRPKF